MYILLSLASYLIVNQLMAKVVSVASELALCLFFFIVTDINQY